MQFSSQQSKFLEWAEYGHGSCVLEAVAGAGKTTTLIEAVARMRPGIVMLAYNKKIADEIREKLNEKDIDFRHAEAGTVHSFGFRAYRKAVKNVQVDGNKVPKLLETLHPPGSRFAAYSTILADLVSLAKQRAVGVTSSLRRMEEWEYIARHFDVLDDAQECGSLTDLEIFEEAARVLSLSNSAMQVVDFDDMVYMPLFHRMRFWQYNTVMVDEAQDTNPARRLLVRALLRRGGRVIAVGDRHQAIYGFTGADNNSLDLIAQEFNCIRLPLTTTYRCPKSVVEFSQQWVQHIEAHETAPQGLVRSIDAAELADEVRDYPGAAILCRNTKPLVAQALNLIRHRIPCKIEGRDVAAVIIKLVKRWKVSSTDKLLEKLEVYEERQAAKLIARQQEAKLQMLRDTVDTVRVVVEQVNSEGSTLTADVIRYIQQLFDDNVAGVVTLSTIHKSKGREWGRVYWLDRAGTLPSRYAKQAWQLEQENNLCYVAATRAQEQLIEVRVQKDPKPGVSPFQRLTSLQEGATGARPMGRGRSLITSS